MSQEDYQEITVNRSDWIKGKKPKKVRAKKKKKKRPIDELKTQWSDVIQYANGVLESSNDLIEQEERRRGRRGRGLNGEL